MTNKIAIEYLKDMLASAEANLHVPDMAEHAEALDMAIEALSAHLVNDSQGFSQGGYISRQDAIDALAKFVPYAICDESTESYTNGLTDAYNLICQLPSAQPEIIQCKDCYWWEKQEASLQGRCDRYGFYPTGYWYCAVARERKENG